MSLKRALYPTNRKVRLLVGLLLAALFAIQCTSSTSVAFQKGSGVVVIGGKQVGSNADQFAALEQMAKTDHIALLETCLRNYREKYQDFTCTFTKQEVINGTTKPEQVMSVKHLAQPFSVAMHWTQNPPTGDTVIFVEGQYDNQMLVRPAGKLLRAIAPVVQRRPDDAEAMKNTLRPVNLFGFDRGLCSLLDIYKKAKAVGELKESYGGPATVDGRQCLVLVRELPDKPEYSTAAPKTILFIDVDYLLPVRIEAFEADGCTKQSLYEYTKLKFNVGLAAKDFAPEANDMQSPK